MYKEALAKTIDKGIELTFLNEDLRSYDLDKNGERDTRRERLSIYLPWTTNSVRQILHYF